MRSGTSIQFLNCASLNRKIKNQSRNAWQTNAMSNLIPSMPSLAHSASRKSVSSTGTKTIINARRL